MDDTKEWEGVYPNKLDDEMKDYTYGDKVEVNYSPYNYYDRDYRHNQNHNIYNRYTGYNAGNKWNKHTGWGLPAGDIAPKFDPNSHFQSPYYDYDRYGWNGNNNDYWRRM